MDFDTNTDVSSHSIEFTPINFPTDHRQEVANAAMKEANDNGDEQTLCSIKADAEKKNTNASPASITKKRAPSPSKRTGKPASPKTPSKKSKKDTEVVAGNGSVTPEGGTPGRATLPPIPTSLATASEMDRMTLYLRDEEKQPWTQINRLFTEKTGIKEARLLRLKKEIEVKFEQEKWHRIVEAIQSDGGRKYPIAALQRKFKELSKNAATYAREAASVTGDDEEE
ncbi:hypothetical protein BDV11DRAFT_167036 [Aspergillus similis]